MKTARLVRTAVIVVCCAGASAFAQSRFNEVPRATIESRLGRYRGGDTRREATLKTMFAEAGCPADRIVEQPVKRAAQPNVMCVLPGDSDDIIVVGAHFDHAQLGDGVADNWSGASLLPSLYTALSGEPRHHTFWFVGFSGEEDGLIGSKAFVAQLAPEQLAKIRLAFILDTLGLGPTEVWVQQSDPARIATMTRVAKAMQLPLTGADITGTGMSDEEPFIAKSVCAVLVHTLTAGMRPILHSRADVLDAIAKDDYFSTFRLTAASLAVIDAENLPPDHACTAKPAEMVRRPRTFVPTMRNRNLR